MNDYDVVYDVAARSWVVGHLADLGPPPAPVEWVTVAGGFATEVAAAGYVLDVVRRQRVLLEAGDELQAPPRRTVASRQRRLALAAAA